MRPVRDSVALRAETANGVIYASVGGVVTLRSVQHIRNELAPVVSAGASVICLDYSKSALVLTPCDLGVLALAAQPGVNGPAMAWIVKDEQTADLWRRQALTFALVGLRRFATTDPAEARHWVALQSREAVAPR